MAHIPNKVQYRKYLYSPANVVDDLYAQYVHDLDVAARHAPRVSGLTKSLRDEGPKIH